MRQSSGSRGRARARAALVVASIVSLVAGVVIAGAGVATAAPVALSPTPIAGWSTNGPVYSVLIVGDTVYAGGEFTQVRGPGGGPTVGRARLAAFDIRTGALLSSFSADTNGTVQKLASDGSRLFVGGSFTAIKGTARLRLAALDLVSGDVVTGFAADAASTVKALVVRGSRLYVGGDFTSIGGVARGRIAALSTGTGAVDRSFDPGASSRVAAIAVSPDGATVYAGGDFAHIGGGSRPYVAALSAATGALTPQVFQYSSYGEVIDLDLSPTGDQLYAGLGDYENQLIAWSTATSRRLFYDEVDGDTQAVRAWDGNVFFGFHEGAGGDDTVRMLVADASSGAIVQSYRPPINSFYGVWDIDASAAGLVIGGEFTQVNGVAVQGLAILPSTGAPVVPTVSAGACSAREGASCVLPVSLSRATTGTVSVAYQARAGSAVAADFAPTAGTLTFAPGQTTKAVAVPLTDDDVVEPAETFTLALSSPSGATLGAVGTGTIQDGTVSYSVPFSAAEAATLRDAGSRYGWAGDELRTGARLLRFLDVLSRPAGLAAVSPAPTSSGPATLSAHYTQAEDATMRELAGRVGLSMPSFHVLGARLIEFLTYLDTH